MHKAETVHPLGIRSAISVASIVSLWGRIRYKARHVTKQLAEPRHADEIVAMAWLYEMRKLTAAF
jgi:hypothetical protein